MVEIDQKWFSKENPFNQSQMPITTTCFLDAKQKRAPVPKLCKYMHKYPLMNNAPNTDLPRNRRPAVFIYFRMVNPISFYPPI